MVWGIPLRVFHWKITGPWVEGVWGRVIKGPNTAGRVITVIILETHIRKPSEIGNVKFPSIYSSSACGSDEFFRYPKKNIEVTTDCLQGTTSAKNMTQGVR